MLAHFGPIWLVMGLSVPSGLSRVYMGPERAVWAQNGLFWTLLTDFGRNYSPNWDHMQFHSGALHSRAAAESGARPDNKTKAKAAVAGFTDGTNRASEKRAAEVAGALDSGSPFKRSVSPKMPPSGPFRPQLARHGSLVVTLPSLVPIWPILARFGPY